MYPWSTPVLSRIYQGTKYIIRSFVDWLIDWLNDNFSSGLEGVERLTLDLSESAAESLDLLGELTLPIFSYNQINSWNINS